MEQLETFMFDFSQLSRRERVIQRNRTERLSELLDWKNLGSYYSRARNMGMEKAFPQASKALVKGGDDRSEVMMPRPFSAPGSRAASPSRNLGSDAEE